MSLRPQSQSLSQFVDKQKSAKLEADRLEADRQAELDRQAEAVRQAEAARAALPKIRKSALELATGLELAEHELSRSKAARAADVSEKAIAAETTMKRSALELATGLELAQHELLSKSTKKMTVEELNKLKQTALELATGIELADYKKAHPEPSEPVKSLVTQFTDYYTKDNGINLGGAFLILVNLILFILLVTFVGQKKGYDNGINYTSETKEKMDIIFTICFVLFLSVSTISYFNYIKIKTVVPGLDAAANALKTAVAAVDRNTFQLSIFEKSRIYSQNWEDLSNFILEFLPEIIILIIIGLIIAFWAMGSKTGLNNDTTLGLNITISLVIVIILAGILYYRGRGWGAYAGVTPDNFKALIIRLALLTIIGLIIAFWAMGSKTGLNKDTTLGLNITIGVILGLLGLGAAIYKYWNEIYTWIIKYSSMFFGSSCILFLLILILYFTNHFGNQTKGNNAAMGISFALFVIVSGIVAYLFKNKINNNNGNNVFSYIYSGISLALFCLFYVLICVMLKIEDSIKSSVSFIITSLNILLVGIMIVNNFSFTSADWVSKIVGIITAIVIIGLLVGIFDITALLINIFAFGLLALTGYGFQGFWTWFNKANTSGDVNNLTTLPTDPATIGLLVAIFIAIIIGIFMLVFYPKKPENNPNNPDVAYNNIMIIIYVLISIIIVGILFKGYQNISKLPSIVGSGMSYIMKLMYSLIGIILYMVFMSYFYGYGGLLTIFAKKNKDGTYDSSIDHDTDKPVNPASLNKTVADLNRSKNTAMIVLAPVTILIGLYILYRGYKVESATMDKSFDTFKKIMLFIFGIIFFIHVWTLNPAQSTFHDTIKSYFSGKMLVVDIFIAIFGIIYAGLSMAKGFVGRPEDASIKNAGKDATTDSVAATKLAELTAQQSHSPIKLIAYVILYIIFIIVTSVGLSTNYFTAATRYSHSWYTKPTGGPTGQDNGFGVCPNNMEYKTDPEGSQCTPCKETEFGCCEDGITAKTDPDGKNCGKLTQGNVDNPHTYYKVDGKEYGSDTKTDPRQARAGGAIFLIILVSIVWLYFTYFELVNLGLIPKNITNLEWIKSSNYIRKLSMVVAGIMISSLTIYVLVTSINGLTTKDKDKKKKDQGVMPFIVNLLTILVILGLLYKILKVGSNPKVNQSYHLALDIIFYIPCLFITLYNNLPSMGKTPAVPGVNEFSQMTYIKILLGVIALYIVYFYIFSYSRVYNNQDGTVILRDPIKLNKLTELSNYLKLNKLDENNKETTGTDKSSEQGSINKFNYHYGMSFWVYLDSVNESQIDKYLTILNYGDKPKVEYNPAKNIMRVTVASNDDPSNDDNRNAEPRIIYTLNNVLLQKWNNIIFNYIGGTVDVFYNGELVASALNVAPYMSYDGLVSGQDNGITGGICNVTYFIKSMTAKQIYYLYNILKDTDPPVMYDTGQTMNNIKNNK
jgi:hypothetical protein